MFRFKSKANLSIQTPCHENWGKMPRRDQGRYCDQCNQIVTDFSVMTDSEIQDFFLQFQGNKEICGNFSPNQMQYSIVAETKAIILANKSIVKKMSMLFIMLMSFIRIFAQGEPNIAGGISAPEIHFKNETQADSINHAKKNSKLSKVKKSNNKNKNSNKKNSKALRRKER
ncbi:MAG: hypothetical protein MUE53_08270 [Chitinophagales bacterium]|jgi:hypothetical protein|nr:hypothetical protein [Chitinophagales bacterium]